MSDNITYKIEEIERLVDYFDKYSDFNNAYDIYKELKKYLDGSIIRSSDPELYKIFFKFLIKLEFLSLNYFDDWNEIGKLLAEHLDKVFELEYFDLWNKIETNLLLTDDMDERDEIKKELIKKLSESENIIINKNEYPNNKKIPITVSDWINDINININSKNISTFEKTKYLTNSPNTAPLKEKDKRKIRILYDLYEKLKLSSKTPQGYENDVPIEINGQLYIFRRGQMELLKNISEYSKDLSGPPKTKEEKTIDELVNKKKQVENIGIAKMAIDEQIEMTKKIEDLKILSNRYRDNSLQKKVIEEEIRKLERDVN
jgi:hypothetical protein